MTREVHSPWTSWHEAFMQVLWDCCKQRSPVITTDSGFNNCIDLFYGKQTTAAMIDHPVTIVAFCSWTAWVAGAITFLLKTRPRIPRILLQKDFTQTGKRDCSRQGWTFMPHSCYYKNINIWLELDKTHVDSTSIHSLNLISWFRQRKQSDLLLCCHCISLSMHLESRSNQGDPQNGILGSHQNDSKTSLRLPLFLFSISAASSSEHFNRLMTIACLTL